MSLTVEVEQRLVGKQPGLSLRQTAMGLMDLPDPLAPLSEFSSYRSSP